nr:hypothetical protein RU989_pgp213 [Laurencia obtusa]WMP12798.1 hypothetical protein [Laurencia obtusa]
MVEQYTMVYYLCWIKVSIYLFDFKFKERIDGKI